MTPFGIRRALKTLIVLSALVVAAPGTLAARDCATRYTECLNTWDNYVVSRDYHDMLCVAEYLDCVTRLLIAM